jgi:hypothetical protein
MRSKIRDTDDPYPKLRPLRTVPVGVAADYALSVPEMNFGT